MFNIGDTVEIINGNVEDHKIGDQGRVIAIIDDYFIKVEVSGKWVWNYHPRELEKIK